MIAIAQLRRLFDGRLGWWLLMPLLLFVAFVSTFYLAFPGRTLQTRLQLELARHGLQAQLTAPQPLFPPGVGCSRLDLTLPGPASHPLPLRQVRVAPLWLSLFGDAPGLRFRADLGGGTLSGTVRRDGQTTLLAERVALREPLQTNGGPVIEGVLQNSRFNGSLPLQAPGQKVLNLALNGVRLSGLESYGVPGGSLDLGRLSLQAEGEGKTLRLTNLSLQGGALQGSGQGTVLIGPSAAATRLNLTLELRPGTGLDPALGDLLELIGSDGPNGARRLRLSGSLQQPELH